MSSCIPIKKHLLLPSNKAWRGFTSKIHSTLQKIKRSKTIKKATKHLNIHSKKKYSTRKHHHHHHRSFKPVYVDELFQQPIPDVVEHVDEQKIEDQKKGVEKMYNDNSLSSASSSSNYVFSKMVGELGEVDVRAEMFIVKFKEQMRLQRQRSLEMYQEMLARGL